MYCSIRGCYQEVSASIDNPFSLCEDHIIEANKKLKDKKYICFNCKKEFGNDFELFIKHVNDEHDQKKEE